MPPCDSAVNYWTGNHYYARIRKTKTGEIRMVYASEEGIYYTKISE
jgi:protease II